MRTNTDLGDLDENIAAPKSAPLVRLWRWLLGLLRYTPEDETDSEWQDRQW